MVIMGMAGSPAFGGVDDAVGAGDVDDGVSAVFVDADPWGVGVRPVGVVGDAVAVDVGDVAAVVDVRAEPAVSVYVVVAGEDGSAFCAVVVFVVAGQAVGVGVVEE